MAMRLKVALGSSGINHVDISKDFQGWLILAFVLLPTKPERSSRMEGGRQFGTYRKRLTLPTSGEVIQVFRVNRDCGNVAYKDFLEQVAVPDPNKLNEIFAHTRMTAEKAGDVSGCWIGALEIAAIARRTVDVFPSRINPADHYNGLERALKTFGRISKSTSTMNDKRKGSFDCSLQGGEATAIMERLNVIREYLEPQHVQLHARD